MPGFAGKWPISSAQSIGQNQSHMVFYLLGRCGRRCGYPQGRQVDRGKRRSWRGRGTSKGDREEMFRGWKEFQEMVSWNPRMKMLQGGGGDQDGTVRWGQAIGSRWKWSVTLRREIYYCRVQKPGWSELKRDGGRGGVWDKYRQEMGQMLAAEVSSRLGCFGDFPGGPVVKTPRFHCSGCGFDPRSGN